MTEQYPRLAALMRMHMRPDWATDVFAWALSECSLEPDVHARIDAAVLKLAGGVHDDWALARGSARYRPSLDEVAVLADRLQAKGDRWGHYLAALLEPRARPELEDEIADLLEVVLRRRERRRLLLRAAGVGLVEVEGEANAELRRRILAAQVATSVDRFNSAVGRALVPAFSDLASSMSDMVGPMSEFARDVQRMNARAENDSAQRRILVRMLDFDSDEVEADVERRGHEAVYRDLAAGTWPRHHSALGMDTPDLAEMVETISAGYERPDPPVIPDHEPAHRGPGIGPRLARRLRKRGR